MCGMAVTPEAHCLGLTTVSRERMLVLIMGKPFKDLEMDRGGMETRRDSLISLEGER